MTNIGDAQIARVRLADQGGDPASPPAGYHYVYTKGGGLYLKDAAGVVSGPLAAGFVDPMTTRGDLIVRNASNVTARLARGAAGRVLKSDGTDVAYGQVDYSELSGVAPGGPPIGAAGGDLGGTYPNPALANTSTARGHLGLGTAATEDIPAAGDASSTQVVYGSDTRLANSRAPSAHRTSHEVGGSDALAGRVPGQTFEPSGLTGATQASRYAGATTSGAPASGTFSVGDFIVDRTGAIYVCTTAGSPGTWTQVGGGGGGFSDPMTARGDLIVRGAGGTTRLGLGARGARLTSDGVDDAWWDTLDVLELVDDFMTGTGTSNAIGQLAWQAGGGGSTGPATSVAGHPGIYNLLSSGASGNVVWLRTNSSSNSFLPSETFDMTWIFRPATADGNTIMRAGVCGDPSVSPPTSGIYLEKAASDTNWFAVTRNAGAQTRTDSGVAVGAGTWVKVRIRRVDASTIGFSINGGAEITHTANIPSAAFNFFAHVSTATTVAKSGDIDFFRCLITGLAR